ncbi:hypothetical protein MKK75_03145 [Methylobacterium sp. J-030]|uniref:hypothetical protein n=1 Tax=Methylobacterium sp. J-030 TaxID=2836627 RepID=UPI001FBA73FF|nr:hypothetical protein [Methylobacterium sp. J-030]MCJ2067812.1 hypothetical protein [Methylobacterium sp. J-030]
MGGNPASICREIYAETRGFYEAHASALKDAALGFRILYGPPLAQAPVLFLGYQPGGKIAEGGVQHETWPVLSEYATEAWPLAVRLRETLGKEVVERSTGLNAIFFRSKSVADWGRIERSLRRELEMFSLARAERIVRTLMPRHVVVIGLGTVDHLTAGVAETLGTRRVLIKRGELWGAPATGIIHLSGARIRREDRERLAAYLAVQQ